MRRVRQGYAYDPALDPATWRGGYNPALAKTDDPVKQLFIQSRRSATARRNGAKSSAKSDIERKAREQAEALAAQAVRQAVQALEMALHNLNGVPAPTDYHKQVNQQQLHNAVVFLKKKCGVPFAEDEFTQHAKLDREHTYWGQGL